MINRLLNTLFCTIAVLASGCSQKAQDPVKEDSISLTSSQAMIDHTAQSLEITVSSSESWTMGTFDYDWVSVSATNGESGENVRFEIAVNYSGSAREATFTFTAGTAEATYTITQASGDYKKLTGTVIGSKYSVDYDNGNSQSTTVNTKNNVFDGKYDTFFASYDRSRTWVGLDLGEKHIITKVGWSPRIGSQGRVELALFEGANKADFSDALPIHIVKEPGQNNIMEYAEVNCSRGFRYVRYVGPNDARCNLAELEFYGYSGEGDDSRLYQLTNLPTVVINTGRLVS